MFFCFVFKKLKQNYLLIYSNPGFGGKGEVHVGGLPTLIPGSDPSGQYALQYASTLVGPEKQKQEQLAG
jgi:hypothetical protein